MAKKPAATIAAATAALRNFADIVSFTGIGIRSLSRAVTGPG